MDTRTFNDKWVDELMTRYGIDSVSELADRIRKPRQSLVQWQSGRSMPSAPAMLAVLNAFDVEPDIFFVKHRANE